MPFVLGNSNDLTCFNNFAKSTNISAFHIYNYLFIIHVMITYNLGKLINGKRSLLCGSQTSGAPIIPPKGILPPEGS